MIQQITVKITKNYGQEAIYPTNEQGRDVLRLTGLKTLSRTHVQILKDLGFKIVVEQEKL